MGHAYPVFLSLEGRRCLIDGLGAVGCRKLARVLACGADSALALDLRPREELGQEAQELLTDNRVSFARRSWAPEDTAGCFLVFACTNDDNENSRLASFCQEHNILCNNITEPERGSFIVPAMAAGGGLAAALCTGGQSPLLARRWRRELETWLEPRGRMAWLLGRLRRPVLALGWTQERNRALFAAIADLDDLSVSDLPAVERKLRGILPQVLHEELNQILTEFAHAFS